MIRRAERERSRVIVAGGEILLEPIREPVLYPALAQLRNKYRDVGGVELIVQTTGDLLNGRYIDNIARRWRQRHFRIGCRCLSRRLRKGICT